MAPRSERAAYIETEDTKGTIHPYIPEDVDSATRVPLTVWVEAVLGLPQERFSDWVRHITENEWCKDEIIYKNLIMFSNTHAEEDRHQPFGRIASRILELGREGLPGTDTCPIDEISIVKNSPKYLKCIPEHTGHGAKRTPDMLVIRRSRYEHLRKIKARAFDWSDVLTFIELKMWNTFLHKKFRAWRAERGLPELDRKTLLPVVPSKDTSAVSSRTRRATAATAEKRLYRRNSDSDSLYEYAHVSDFNSDNSDDAYMLRSNPRVLSADPKLQAGAYALETVACTYGTRLFTTGIVMQDDKTSLWYYDACSIIRTDESLSLFYNFEEFAAVLVAFACCEPSQWGCLPPSIIKPPLSAPYPENFPPRNLKDYTLDMVLPEDGSKVCVTLQDPIFTQYSLVGRRTFLYTIKTNSSKFNKPMVAKFSYQVATRQREQHFIEVASKAGVGHLPEVHMWADLWKMSEGVRAIFFDRCGPDPEYEDRVFRGIVYTQYFPLKDLFSKSCELIPTMVYQMLDCLHDLRYKAKILHCDISANNIMWEMQGDEVVFKLIDFDSAIFVDDDSKPIVMTARAKRGAGTLTFMAYEVAKGMANRDNPRCKPVIHFLRHDFESLLYLSVYCMHTMPEMSEEARQALYKETIYGLENRSLSGLASMRLLIWDSDWPMVLPSQCEMLRPWYQQFRDIFRAADFKINMKYRRDESNPFDKETVDGILTRDAIKGVLKGESVVNWAALVIVPVHQEASGSGISHEETIEEEATEQNREKKAAPTRRAPVKKATGTKDSTKGKKVASAKGTKKIASAKASQTAPTISNAKLAAGSKTRTFLAAATRRGPTTRSITKKTLIAS